MLFSKKQAGFLSLLAPPRIVRVLCLLTPPRIMRVLCAVFKRKRKEVSAAFGRLPRSQGPRTPPRSQGPNISKENAETCISPQQGTTALGVCRHTHTHIYNKICEGSYVLFIMQHYRRHELHGKYYTYRDTHSADKTAGCNLII